MHTRILTVALVAFLSGLTLFASFTAPALAGKPVLPATVSEPGNLDQVPSPAGERSMFYLFQPPEQARFGVAEKDGTIVWEKNAGYRPLVDYFWSADGAAVAFVTDCIQPEAELRSPASATRSWFFVLEAASGKVLAEGDLDTDVLDLPKQLPEAVGASHQVKIEIKDGKLEATIDHCGKTVSGSRALKELAPKAVSPKPGKP